MVGPDLPVNLKTKQAQDVLVDVCAGRESNPHAFRHVALNHACLPVPAPALEHRNYNLVDSVVKLNPNRSEGE